MSKTYELKAEARKRVGKGPLVLCVAPVSFPR